MSRTGRAGPPNNHRFWRTIALSMVDGMLRGGFGWPTQLVTLLQRLATDLGLKSADRDAICGERSLTTSSLDRFIHALHAGDDDLSGGVEFAARARAMLASGDLAVQYIGHDHRLGRRRGQNRPLVQRAGGADFLQRPARVGDAEGCGSCHAGELVVV
jgi:hypothetical protein